MSSYIPLHLHSQYSILDSTIGIADLVDRAEEYGMSAVALTDQGNLFGAVDFYKACKKKKVKPIIGCELYVASHSRHEKKREPGQPHGYQLVLLAKDNEGYRNLCKLSSYAHLEGFYYTPRIDKELLAQHKKGLICLSGGVQGLLASLMLRERDAELAKELDWFQELFGDDFYLEIQRHRMTEEQIREDELAREDWAYQNYLDYVAKQEKVIQASRKLAQERSLRMVATSDSRYLDRADWRAHEILLNVQSGEPVEILEKDSFGNAKRVMLNPKRKTAPSHSMEFCRPERMSELFSDLPEALQTSLQIAEQCTTEIDLKTKHYPVFVPEQLEKGSYTEKERAEAVEKHLRALCQKGIAKRYTPERLAKIKSKFPDKDPLHLIEERLEHELQIICSKGMSDYLLIVCDFISWAKQQKIPMGPGRGSGAGSIILYLIEVTDIEPLYFGLFFERFINPERLSYPDIDVDICMDRRGEVIDYTVRKYGKEKVAQIITFGTMKAKMAIKDVGRVLSIPLARVNTVSKLIPEDPTMTLKKALESDQELRDLYESDPEVKRWIDLAKNIEGSVRSTGIHAAGIIISADPLVERIPLCQAKDSDLMVTQYSMKPVESVGMLKIDFLGLKTLTAIQLTVDAIRSGRGEKIDWIDLPLDDKKTFDLLNHGKTQGIFQVESAGMQELVKQLHLDRFEEIIAVGALYRPGPMEMIPSFIERKHGREKIEFDHPLMEEILAETYGIMVYQEQVMQMASLLANYSLGEGDVLRRAMGKKDKEEMALQRVKFREGALKNGISEEVSMRIFDKVEKFASYGFNKSHAAAYGYLTYVTAFLKANYPNEWMAALMTSDREDITKVAKVIRECQAMKIAILSPDVNESGKEFVATPKGIRFAMTAVKGVGEGVVELIVAERDREGPFASLYDFVKRINTKKVGRKVIETLIEAGCFDFTGWSRPQLLLSIPAMYAAASVEQKESSQGVMNLFSLIEQKEDRFTEPPVAEEFPKEQLLKREKELLGFYLTGHPLDAYRAQFQKLSCVPLSHFEQLDNRSVVRTACIIESLEVRTSAKSGRKFAILTISDGLDCMEVPIWADLYADKALLIEESRLVYAVLQIEKGGEEVKLQCRWIEDLRAINEEKIAECDLAYDKAKEQVRYMELRDKKASSEGQEKKENKPVAPPAFTMRLDAEKLTLTQILDLKELFRSSPGGSPLSLLLQDQGRSVGELSIESPWGVSFSKQFEEKLARIPSFISVQEQ